MRQSLLLGLALTIVSATSWAQVPVLNYYQDQQKLIKAPTAVQQLGDNLFGDQVNLYTGNLEFVQQDLSVPGNSKLPVAIARRMEAGTQVEHNRAFGNWDLEIPHLHGIFYAAVGWQDSSKTGARCSNFGAPPAAAPTTDQTWNPGEFWHGNFLYVPGKGDEAMLKRDPSNPNAPGAKTNPAVLADYPVVTTSMWAFKCIPLLAGSQGSGEGFEAHAPDGTVYLFNWLVKRDANYLSKASPSPIGSANSNLVNSGGSDPNAAGGSTHGKPGPGPYLNQDYRLLRAEVWLLPTRVTDKYGNVVVYTYDANKPWNLLQIAGNDQPDSRTINLFWTQNAEIPSMDRIDHVTDGLRTWNYAYSGGILSTVTQPDKTTWQLADLVRLQQDIDYASAPGTCSSPRSVNSGAISATLTHPSGASGTFVLTPTTHARTHVDPNQQCATVAPNGDSPTEIPLKPLYFTNYALTEKDITGFQLGTLTWTTSYPSGQVGSIGVCSGDACDGAAAVAVTGPAPDHNVTVTTFGTDYGVNEGRVRSVDVRDGSGSTLRLTSMDYLDDSEVSPYGIPASMGSTKQDRGDGVMAGKLRPMKSRDIAQQGLHFAWTASNFDPRGRPLAVSKAGTASRSEQMTYTDIEDFWVLGGLRILTVNGVEDTNVGRNAKGDVISMRRFGKTLGQYNYYPNGTVSTYTDGNLNPTNYLNYSKGVPRTIQYPEYYKGAQITESAQVNSYGAITSLTDMAGYTTQLGYDPIGRLNQITYPFDANNWHAVTISFGPTTDAEFGISPSGNPELHWRQIIDVGSATGEPRSRTVTIYDALWRPIATQAVDRDRISASATGSVTQYDHASRVTFTSYPTSWPSVPAPGPGVKTTYDALGRATTVAADSELGSLTTTTFYENSFRKTVQNPRNISTTYSYQAFDEPTEDAIIRIDLPESVQVSINRDIWSKPQSITRSGNPGSATRTYSYDANQLLCKQSEPESGATFFSYDGANNMIAKTAGQSSGIACGGAIDTSKTLHYTYDKLNRQKNILAPDNTTTLVGRALTQDGMPELVTSNGSSWSYAYNSRRLLAGETLTFGSNSFTLSHGYDQNAHQNLLTYPDGVQVKYDVDALGQPMTVCAWSGSACTTTYASGITHYPNGALSRFTYGNGIVHSLSLNARNLPQTASDGTLFRETYAYDENANVHAITEDINTSFGANTRTMSYDNLDRLTQVALPGTLWQSASYTYDGLDNITSSVIGGGSTARSQSFTIDYGKNQLTGIRNNATGAITSYGYDVFGNVTNLGSQGFRFDLLNRLTTAVSPVAASYAYDGWNRRYSVVGSDHVNRYLVYSQDGKLMYAGITGSPGTKYIYLHNHLLADDNRSSQTYYHTDGLGSPLFNTTATGSVVNKSYYEPYGKVAAGDQQTFGFGGHLNASDLGLIYMQQRFYDPVAGRFLSVDPVATGSSSDSSFGRYAYANNNPYKYIDPDGRSWVLAGRGAILGAEGGFAVCGPWCSAAGAVIVGGAALWAGEKALNWIASSTDGNKDTLKPGEHAGESVPARSPDRDFTKDERDKINQIGGSSGCHTCGSTDPGTSSGNFVPDHQPPNALNPTGGQQQLYPHCLNCSRVQGGQVRGEQARKPNPPQTQPKPEQQKVETN
ncbi:MAG: RHS repeat domain-containing protein [Telluria sp.]